MIFKRFLCSLNLSLEFAPLPRLGGGFSESWHSRIVGSGFPEPLVDLFSGFPPDFRLFSRVHAAPDWSVVAAQLFLKHNNVAIADNYRWLKFWRSSGGFYLDLDSSIDQSLARTLILQRKYHCESRVSHKFTWMYIRFSPRCCLQVVYESRSSLHSVVGRSRSSSVVRLPPCSDFLGRQPDEKSLELSRFRRLSAKLLQIS